MGIDFPRLAFGSRRLSCILEISQGFLLLGVHRNRGLSPPLLRLHSAIDEPKLGVTIGMRLSLACLAVGLQTVTGFPQQLPHSGRPYRMPLSCQFLGQTSRTLAGPTQWRLRITSAFRFDQPFQRCLDSGIDNLRSSTARTLPTLASSRRHVTGSKFQFENSSSNRAMGQSRRRTHYRNPATTQRHCFDSRPASASTLRQLIEEPLILVLNPLNNTLTHNGGIIAFTPPFTSTPVSSVNLRAVP